MNEKPHTNLLGDHPTITTVVERIDAPMTWWENIKSATLGAVKGSLISGLLSGLVGGVIGAISGANSAETYTNQLETNGSIKLGGFNIPGIGVGPSITVVPEMGVGEALQSNPMITGAALGATNAALNVGTSAALVGAGVGYIKGAWSDRVIKERIIKQEQAPERT